MDSFDISIGIKHIEEAIADYMRMRAKSARWENLPDEPVGDKDCSGQIIAMNWGYVFFEMKRINALSPPVIESVLEFPEALSRYLKKMKDAGELYSRHNADYGYELILIEQIASALTEHASPEIRTRVQNAWEFFMQLDASNMKEHHARSAVMNAPVLEFAARKFLPNVEGRDFEITRPLTP